MIETGVVTGREAGGTVRVEIVRTAACDGCHARGACAMVWQNRRLEVSAADPLGAAPGATVTLDLPDGDFLTACAVAYAIPLATMVAGAVGTWAVLGGPTPSPHRDPLSALGALAGAGLGLVLVRLLDRRLGGRPGGRGRRFRAVVTGIVS